MAGSNFSLSVVKFNATNGLNLADFSTPYNHQTLASEDLDMTGLRLLPPQSGTYRREMIGIGKEGTIYLLNRDHLGGLCANCTSGDTQIVQEIPGGAGVSGGNPCFWNDKVYFTGQRIPIQAYTVLNGTLVVPPANLREAWPEAPTPLLLPMETVTASCGS